jgi:hypothetical protein
VIYFSFVDVAVVDGAGFVVEVLGIDTCPEDGQKAQSDAMVFDGGMLLLSSETVAELQRTIACPFRRLATFYYPLYINLTLVVIPHLTTCRASGAGASGSRHPEAYQLLLHSDLCTTYPRAWIGLVFTCTGGFVKTTLQELRRLD